jgi:hypothetical protein
MTRGSLCFCSLGVPCEKCDFKLRRDVQQGRRGLATEPVDGRDTLESLQLVHENLLKRKRVLEAAMLASLSALWGLVAPSAPTETRRSSNCSPH